VLHIARDRREALFIGIVGIAAAFFLLDQNVSPWLRVLPWLLVFGYPLARMLRGLRQRRS
jgi:Ca2+/Na+ antiporter